MSTDQQVKPRCANQSITDESARPGTLKSKVGCDAIDEPWTNNAAGLPSDVPTYFSQRKRRTSPLCVQCSLPVTVALLLIVVSTIFQANRRAPPAICLSSAFRMPH